MSDLNEFLGDEALLEEGRKSLYSENTVDKTTTSGSNAISTRSGESYKRGANPNLLPIVSNTRQKEQS